MGQILRIPIFFVFLTDTSVQYYRIILVDSTRSGKRIPDALSKTVPIWCAVMNRAMIILHPEITNTTPLNKWDTALYTPPGSVSIQEHHHIEQRLDSWANSLAVRIVWTAQYNRISKLFYALGFIILSADSTLSTQTNVDYSSYNYLSNDWRQVSRFPPDYVRISIETGPTRSRETFWWIRLRPGIRRRPWTMGNGKPLSPSLDIVQTILLRAWLLNYSGNITRTL